MLMEDLSHMVVEQRALASQSLNRYVIIDLYLPKNIERPADLHLLLINDGQDLQEMAFGQLLNGLVSGGEVPPLLCVGIHANKDRKNEYGTAALPDYEGRGARGAAFQRFVLEELLPFIQSAYAVEHFQSKAYCGFSLGGLSALDTAWNHPGVFSLAGVFSGSLWWRSQPLGPDYNDDLHRIMHQQVRKGSYNGAQRYYFTTGSLDESADRNGNGVIDSIDDTEDLIRELKAKGCADDHICYVNYEDGRHDIATWGRALPDFLRWGWKIENTPRD
jgi:enterochelin esterase-like enzyme